MVEIFYGKNNAVKKSFLSNQDYVHQLENRTKGETLYAKAYLDAFGERVLMEWSLKLVYAESLESGKIYPIENIDNLVRKKWRRNSALN